MELSKSIRLLTALSINLLILAGVAPPAHAAIISTEQEIQIGRNAAREIAAEYGVLRNPQLTQRVVTVGLQVAKVSERRDLPWTFEILNVREVNAISLPGGFIYVTRGMMNFLKSDDELAFVLAHEVGHVDRRHHVSLIERNFFFTLVIVLIFGRDPTAAQIADFARFLITRGFGREFEFEADEVGVRLTHRAGFDAGAGLGFMERLRAAEGRDPSQFEVLFRTHPALADRIVRVRDQLRYFPLSP